MELTSTVLFVISSFHLAQGHTVRSFCALWWDAFPLRGWLKFLDVYTPTLIIHLSTTGHSHFFHLSAIVNDDDVGKYFKTQLWILVDIPEVYYTVILISVFEEPLTIFHNSCVILQSYQQSRGIPILPCLCQIGTSWWGR